MKSIASKIRRKACAHLWKNASPIGKTAEGSQRFFNLSLLIRAIFSRALTLPRARQRRFLGRHRSLAVLRGVVPRSERFSDLFGVTSLSGHHRRNRPHGSRSPAGHPYRVARAKFDGDRLRAWVAGSARRRYRILRLPRRRAEKNQGWRRN